MADTEKQIICPICDTVLKDCNLIQFAIILGYKSIKRCNLSHYARPKAEPIKLECPTCGTMNLFNGESKKQQV